MSRLLLLVALLAGCGFCQRPENKLTPRCQVQSVVVSSAKCAETGIAKLVSQWLPVVVGDLVSGDFGAILDSLVATLTQQGVTDALTVVTCAVQQADGNIPAMKREFNPNLFVIKTHAQLYLAAHK